MADQVRAYVPGYQHDVFVSYAHVDDVPDNEEERGWVSCLVEQLNIRLAQLLGRPDIFSIWQDVRLAKNVDFSAQIATSIENSAMLLVVLSPGYMASEWCRRERESFLKWVHHRLESGSRVFLVERDRVDSPRPDEFGKPSEFQNLLGYRFWVEEHTISRPLNKYRKSQQDRYDDLRNELAWDIARELKRLRDLDGTKVVQVKTPVARRDSPNVTPASPQGPAPDAVKVYLAEATDDLRTLRKKVQRHLEQFGLQCVASEASRSPDADSVQAAVDGALGQVRVFVQLLSDVLGPSVPDSEESFVVFQHRRAKELGKTVLQWRDPSVTEVSWDKASEEDDEVDLGAHRELLFGETVQAVSLEDFKRHVVETATRPTPPPPDPGTDGSDGGLIFVNFNRATKDTTFAEELSGYLSQKGFGVIQPVDLSDAPPETIREEFEANVRDCRGLIVVYGDQTAKLWTRRQLSETYKLFCEHRKPLYALALCAGPPANYNADDPVGYKPPKMTMINCQTGFEFEKLTPFLDVLRGNASEPRPAQPKPAVV